MRQPRRHNAKHSHTATRKGSPSSRRSTRSGGDPVLFGDRNVEPTLDSNPAGLAEAFPFSSQTTGTATSISVYVDSHNKAPALVAGLYSNSDGHPGSRLASGSLSSPRAGAWNTVTVSSTVVRAGRTYWVAVLGKGATLYFRDRSNGPCDSESSYQADLNHLRSRWRPGARWRTCPISAYVSGAVRTAVPVTTPAPALPPVSTAAPQISGTPTQGQTLSASDGSWTNAPTSYAYAWQDCDTSGGACADIAGAGSSSYTLATGDVGHTIRAVVTATNAGGSASATSAQTAVVASSSSTGQPSNTALPQIGGAAAQGQPLTASNGSWDGGPTAYSYQWQDCDSVGAGCVNISGATGSSYTPAPSDGGHAIRVVVTATSSSGSAQATSAATAPVGAPGLSCTTTLSPGANVSSAIASASGGAVICLSAGSYSKISISSSYHTSYVTVQPAPGASATVAGFYGVGVAFLRLQGIKFTSGVDFRSDGHDLQLLGNDIGNADFGIAFDQYPPNPPISHILIQGNHIHNLDSECATPGYATGQGVTMSGTASTLIEGNTFQTIPEHYIQGGNAVVDGNLFEGPALTPGCPSAHLNIWQIWSGGRNDAFINNVMRPGMHTSNSIMFETGPGGANPSDTLSNITISNNLFDHETDTYSIQECQTNGLTITNNTIVGSTYGLWARNCSGTGSSYDISRNIVVQNAGRTPEIQLDGCAGTCTFDYNVTDDGSADQAGSTHYVIHWNPQWQDTTWYQPIGLSFQSGFTG